MALMQPLPAYRFRVAGCKPELTQNVDSVHIDFVNRKITVLVRATIIGSDFETAINFGDRANFRIDAMDGGNNAACFSIHPMIVKLEAHDVTFAYAGNKVLLHTFVFSYQQIDVRYEVAELPELPKDPRFLSMEEALEVVQNLEKKIDPKTGKQILTEEAPKSKVVTIMDDPVERGDAGC